MKFTENTACEWMGKLLLITMFFAGLLVGMKV